MNDFQKRYPNVTTGEGLTLYPPVILGMPSRGTEEGELPLIIGRDATILIPLPPPPAEALINTG